MSAGTPKTLKQALMNGLVHATKIADWNDAQKAKFASLAPEAQKLASAELQDKQMAALEEHVLDFLRQKFGAAYLLADELDGEAATASLNAVRTLALNIGVEKPWGGPAEVAALEAAIAAGEIGPKARRS